MNKIFVPSNEPENWRSLLAEPDKHWRPGYSAMALAFCWQQAHGFPDCVQRVFSASDMKLFQTAKLLLAFPEYKVPLPGGARSSQNDLFILAKGDGRLISMAVEGKVSEPFGPTVSEWLKEPSRGKETRLKFLCKTLSLDRQAAPPIRWQLLHRTASVLIEAEKFNASHALMLVHSFSRTYEGFADYAAFLSLYDVKARKDKIHCAGNLNGIQLFFGWVRGDIKYLSAGKAETPIKGTVAARKCPRCGHHEIGIINEKETFVALKPGMHLQIDNRQK